LQIVEYAKSQGTVPDEIVRWAKQKLKPQVDWRRELRAAVQGALAWTMGLEDYTYTRPNRRQSALPQVVLPSLRKPLPRVAVVVDTSGSMGEGELAQALAEIGAVLRQVREVTVLSVDAAGA
jgi:predicted metal-dependent peptidase